MTYKTSIEKATKFGDRLTIKLDSRIANFLAQPFMHQQFTSVNIDKVIKSINSRSTTDTHEVIRILLKHVPCFFIQHAQFIQFMLGNKPTSSLMEEKYNFNATQKADVYHLTKSFPPISLT